MKKYLLKESKEVINFGDSIVVDNTRTLSDGTIRHCHLNCTFTPELVDLLEENEVIEEVEEKEEDGLAFNLEEDNPIECLIEALDFIGKQVDFLTNKIMAMDKSLESLKEALFPKKQPAKESGKKKTA